MIRSIIHTLLLSILLTSFAQAAIDAVEFKDTESEQRYQSLIAELRCLVCQNQNLADSDADLAKDLRRKTAEMIKAGKSDDEILEYMRERYGDFVLYRPPLNAGTVVLWVGPFILLLIAVYGIFRTIRRRQDSELMRPAQANNDAQRIKVRNLIKTAPDLMIKSSDENKKEDND